MTEIQKLKTQLCEKQHYNFDDLLDLVKVLRSDEGCVWDREQTNKSIRNALIDETYEFIEGLDADDNELMCEELGDVLFQVIFHAQITKEDVKFDVNNVIDGICKKMIERHPHVFGDTFADTSEKVLETWEKIKNKEKERKTPYEQLKSVAVSLPSLMRCQKLLSKSYKTGLSIEKSFDEIKSEMVETLDNISSQNIAEKDIGKLLFCAVSLAKAGNIDAEQALYNQNNDFLRNFEPENNAN